MHGALGKFPHADGIERSVHALADQGGFNAEIFRPERNVLLHNGGDDLIVGVLKYDADGLPDRKNVRFVGGRKTVDQNGSGSRKQQPVDVLGKRAFSTAVVSDYGDKRSVLNRERNVVQRFLHRFLILKSYMIELNQNTKVLSKVEIIIQGFFTFFK